MALPTGTISMSQVNTELGRPATQSISLDDAGVRGLADRASGYLSMSHLQGKSAVSLGITGGFNQTTSGGFSNYYDRGTFSAYTSPSGQSITTYQWDVEDDGGMLSIIGSTTEATFRLDGPTYSADNFPNTYTALIKCTATVNGMSKYAEFTATYQAGFG